MALLERSAHLAELRELFEHARAGQGRLVCVCAEAGGGKSALVQAFADSVASQAAVLTGWCDPFDTPRPAGPLLDMGAGLGAGVVRILREEGRAGLFDAVLDRLATGDAVTVLVIEDVHWADGTTLDLLRFLGRRVTAMPALVVITYRDDEIGPGHPLRALLGDLATQRGIARLELPPLTLDAVATLAGSRAVDPRRVLAVTGGNPFFVSQVLAEAAVEHVPVTVADAVLARLARLPESARRAITVAATVGARAEPSVLYDVPGIGPADLDAAAHAGLMRLTPPFYTFRHELVRQAVLSVTGAGARQAIAAQVLAVLMTRPVEDDALGRLAELAETAGDAEAVARFAPAAARRAADLGAHREAAGQYARALRHVTDDSVRAGLLEACLVERYLVGDLPAAIEDATAAASLRRAAGEPERLGDDLRWLARLHWYSGHGSTALQVAMEAFDCLQQVGPSAELAMSLSQLSQLRMLAGSYAEAIGWGEQALAVSRELELPDVTAHSLNNIGASRCAQGDPSGLELLRQSLALSLDIGSEDHASRAYVNLVGDLLLLRRTAEGLALAQEGLEYCTARDLDLQTPYLRGQRSLLLVHAGRWDDAVAEAENVVRTSTGTSLHDFVARLPLAVVAIRRGQPVDLDDLGARARQLDEILRLAPYASARAEALWLAGRPATAEIVQILARGREADVNLDVIELAVWLARLGVDVGPAEVGPMAGVLSDPVSVAERLAELGNPYDAAVCLLSGTVDDVHRAAEIFSGLGAAPALAKAQARLRELGASRIPRGPRASTRANDLGLTERQHDVLALVAEGLTNAEIAARLYLSERTVEHHVSAVLAKLGANSREQAGRRYGYRAGASWVPRTDAGTHPPS